MTKIVLPPEVYDFSPRPTAKTVIATLLIIAAVFAVGFATGWSVK